MLDWLNDFKPPKDTVELLERALEWAEDEKRWVTGNLFLPKAVTYEQVSKMDDKEACESVGACAMGIILVAAADGSAVKEVLASVGEADEVEYVNSFIATPEVEGATRALATAFSEDTKYVDREDVSVFDAESVVVSYNDSYEQALRKEFVDRDDHHKNIVEGFKKALEIAKSRGE
jgi:hypothetical protein